MRCGCGRESTEDEHVKNAPESLPRRRDGERGWFLLTADGIPFEERDFGRGDMRPLMSAEFTVGEDEYACGLQYFGKVVEHRQKTTRITKV